MSGLLGGIANLAGALSQGNDLQNQERVKSALQQAQLVRQQQQDQIASAVRQRQAQSATLQDRLTQAQIGDTEAQTQQRAYEVAHPKPIAPVLGTPEFEVATDRIEKIKHKYDRTPQAPAEPSWQVVPTANGLVQVNPKTGETRAVTLPGGVDFQKPMTGSQKKEVATNQTSVSTIDKAIKSLKTHQDATGFFRGRSDYADQLFDPEGVDTRALIANVGSQIVHDRSGAAVTVSEYPRLAPFIPSVHDKPEAIRKKLLLLRDAIATETQGLGGEIPAYSDDDAPQQAATPAASASAPVSGVSHDRLAAIKAKHGLE